MGSSTIRSFTGLIAWQEAHKLVLKVYQTTKSFPVEERSGLISQLRRAAVSISSNIAEGFSRNSRREKRRFYEISQASLTEVQNELLISKDVGYLHPTDFQKIADQTVIVSKLISGLKKSASSAPTHEY